MPISIPTPARKPFSGPLVWVPLDSVRHPFPVEIIFLTSLQSWLVGFFLYLNTEINILQIRVSSINRKQIFHMKQQTFYQKFILLALTLSTAINSNAQQHFTLTCNNTTNNTGCRECNTACALIYTPQLNASSILLARQLSGASHPLGVWYKPVNGMWLWNVNYQDAKTMNLGEKFDVEYYENPDPNYQFVHHVYQPGATQKVNKSYIDHINLNGKPKANFRYIANGNGTNLYPITFKYDASPGVNKWYLYNTNGKELDLGAVYNIVIDPKAAFNKSDILVDPTHHH
jgi:hypothetical protein